MGNVMKRLTAMLLLVCTLASFVVPATFADNANAINYDFQLYNNSQLSSVITGEANKYGSSGVKNAIEGAYTAGTHNWKVEAVAAGVSTTSDMRFYKNADEGLRLMNFTADDWMALRIKVGTAGKYSVSLTGGTTASTYNYNATAWVATAPAEGTMSVSDIEAAKEEDGNKLGTASITYSDKTDSLGEYTFAAGEYVLILSVSNSTRSSIADINLTRLEETTDTTASTGADASTGATGATDTTAPAGEPVNYDFQLYNNDLFAEVIPGEANKLGHPNVKKAINDAYDAGTHNWKVEATAEGVSTTDDTKFYKTADEGLRLMNFEASDWLALRIRVGAAGEYRVSLTGGTTGDSYNYNATAWLVAAPAEGTMSATDVAAAMVDGNKLGTASITYSDKTDALGEYTFAAGEYILILSVSNSTRSSIADIDLTPKTEEDDSTVATESTGATESIETTVAPETTESTESNETTTGEAVVYQSNTFDFELYKKAEFSSVINGLSNKYHKPAVQKAVKDAYPSANNWIVETVAEGVSLENLQFNTKEGFSMRVGANNWAALRLNVTQAGKYEIVLNSIYAQTFTTALWVFPAPANTMTPAEVLACMIDPANLLGEADVTAGQPKVAGEYTFAEGEYIVVMASKGDRVSFSSIVLAEPGSTGPQIPQIPTQPNVPAGSVYASGTFDFELYKNAEFSSTIDGNYNKYSKTAVKKAIEDAYPAANNWVVEGCSAGASLGNMSFIGNGHASTGDEGLRISIGADKWVAFRLNVTQAGEYDLVVNSLKADTYTASTWLIPASAETMGAAQLEAAMTSAYAMGDIQITSKNLQSNIGTYNFQKGEYILIVKTKTDRLPVASIAMTTPGTVELPPEDTRPEYENKPGYFDMRLFNYKGFDGLTGEYVKYNKVESMLESKYPTAVNWILEAHSENLDNSKIQFIGSKGEGLRATLPEKATGEWIALRLNNTKSGKYDLVINSDVGIYSGKVYLFPATAAAMTAKQIAALMTDENLMGNINFTKDVDIYNLGEYDFAAGEYIVVLQAAGDRVTVDSIELATPGTVELPPEDTRPEYENKPGYFDMRLFNYKGFDALTGEYVKYNKVESMLESKYPTSTNWILEAVSANLSIKDNVQFIVSKGEGLRAGKEGVNGEWIALRLNNTKSGKYDLVINSDVGSYSGKAYLFPATAEAMTAEQISALMTEKNLLGNFKFDSELDSYNLGEYAFVAGEYIVVLQADKDRVTVDSIEIIDHYVEVPKTPVDKMYYDFDLVAIDPQFNDKGFTNWYDSATKKEKVEKKIADLYKNDVIQWKYETMSSTASRFNCRKDHTQIKSSKNFREIENAWNAVRIEAPGAGTYDIRLNSDVKSGVVADIYLIPARTGVSMTKAEIEAAMTAQNCLVSGVLLSGEGDFYLGEYTFGTEYEYVLVIKFSYGMRLYINHIEVTKDGLVADTEVKKLPVYNGVVYDFDIGDEFTGILQPLGEYRYDMPTPKENGYKSPYEQMKAFWNSGKINWKWIAGSDDLVEYDENMNTYPNDYNRFYSETGMHIYSKPGSWVAFQIKSPGSGDFTLTMNHAVAANDGTVAVYILPADTPNEEIYNATDPSNRVGKVVLTKPDGSAGKKDGFESFVGYWNFEAGKEYILVLEAYAASQFSASMSNMNISNIVMQKGIHEYKTEKDKTVKPVTVKERVLATSDLGNGNVAIFEMNGMDYYLTHLEGGTLLLYNLTTGELEKESYLSAARPRHMAVAPDGKIWLTGGGKCLAYYDPVENTVTKTKTFMPKEYKHNAPSYMTITPEGMIYFTLNGRGNIVEYNPETKQFRDLGYFVDPLDDTNDIFYLDGYLYTTHLVAGSHNCVVKYNIATGKIEGKLELIDHCTTSLYALSLLGEDTIVVGAKTTDNDHTMAFNKDTMELVDLGLPGSVSKLVTSEINGKQYMVLASYGLYEYDVETKEIIKTPGFSEMTGTGFRGGDQHSFGKSWAMINGDLCLISNDSQVTSCPRVINLTKKEYYRWTDLTRDAAGGGSRIISFTETEPGAGELVMGHWNAEFISTYNINTGEVTFMDSAGQTDSIGYYKGILYGGCYSATVLVELHRETEEIIQRFKLDHELTGQKRLLSMETGGDHVFVGSVPGTQINGGALTVYNTITGQWYYERNLVQDQSIIDMAYSNELVFAASSLKGGDNSQDMGDSAVIVAYDYKNREKLAVLDPRDYIPGLASPVVYVYGLTADPNTEENGRIWAVVSDTLFCFTFDRETKKFDVQEVLSLGKSKYDISSGVGRVQRKIRFIHEENQMYVMLSGIGIQKVTLDDWNAPIGKVKIKSYETLMGYKPEDYIIAEDGNFYFGNDADLMMIPLNVTDEDWAIAEKMDAQIQAIKDGEITLASESAIRTARSDYENMSWRYKALIQNLELLQEAESDILECKIDAGILEAGQIDADDYPAMLALHEEYEGLTTARQKRYVKNYKNLKEAYELSSKLNDERCAAAMQEKINKLKDIMPIESLEKEPEVVAVRTEFEAMPGRQRILVDTKILEEAEAQIAVLRAELVKQVEALIQAIPAEITLEAEPAILAAREGVDKLTALERKQVSYSKLESAEAKLRNLKNALAKAQQFDAMMKEIGIVTLADAQRIANARQFYNSLNETARAFAKKAGKLNRAEFILKGLQTWMIPAIVVVDLGAAFAVVWFVPSLHSKVFKTKKKEDEPVEN